MSLPYAFRLALQSILRERWIYLLSVLTIAAGLLFTTATALFVYNIDEATRRLPEKFSVILYLTDTASEEDRDIIMNTARKQAGVEKVIFIPKDQALKELKTMLKDSSFILEGLGENPLPDAVEIKLQTASFGPEPVKRLIESLQGVRGVQEIEYGDQFLSAIQALRTGMNRIGMTIVVIMTIGMLFVCYSTVKILFYRREREIETYKLLGATSRFIRTPFLLEGAIIGVAAGVASLAGILSFYYLLIVKLGETFPLLKLLSFPPALSLALPISGLMIGMAGAVIALGRIRY